MLYCCLKRPNSFEFVTLGYNVGLIMDTDKREFPRVLFSRSVQYAQPDVAVNGGVSGNISLGGMSLKVQEFVAVGVILELQIRLDQSPKVIWAKAQVVRVREALSDDCYEIGLKFIKDEEFIKAVGKYIKGVKNYG